MWISRHSGLGLLAAIALSFSLHAQQRSQVPVPPGDDVPGTVVIIDEDQGNYSYCTLLASTMIPGTLQLACSNTDDCENDTECDFVYEEGTDGDGHNYVEVWCDCDGADGDCNGKLTYSGPNAGNYMSADCDGECPDHDTDGDLCMSALSFPGMYPICMCYH